MIPPSDARTAPILHSLKAQDGNTGKKPDEFFPDGNYFSQLEVGNEIGQNDSWIIKFQILRENLI